MAEDELEVVLTAGSKYRVKSIESREKPLISHGIFRGFAVVGHDDALAIELDDSHGEHGGRIRLIPAHMIVAIDVLEAASSPQRTETVERMFG